jgi:hypothetical protein
MTNEEVIKRLKEARNTIQPFLYVDEAIDYAIKVLEQQPSEDYISRKSVNTLVDELARAISDERCCITTRGRSTATIMQDILNLPSVTPTRPKGKWIDDSKEDSYYANCSHCDYQIDTHYERGYLNYCPNCGAKMEVEE